MSKTAIKERDTVDFYFAYLSPYAFMANLIIQDRLEGLGVSLRYFPVAHRVDGDAPNFHPERLNYIYQEDVPRYAKKLGIEVHKSPILGESYCASAAYLYASEHGVGEAFNKDVFAARWILGEDISDVETLSGIAVQNGLTASAIAEVVRSEDYLRKLQDVHRRRDEFGIFGAPTFVYRGERFWGNDRIDHLIEAIQQSHSKH